MFVYLLVCFLFVCVFVCLFVLCVCRRRRCCLVFVLLFLLFLLLFIWLSFLLLLLLLFCSLFVVVFSAQEGLSSSKYRFFFAFMKERLNIRKQVKQKDIVPLFPLKPSVATKDAGY